MDTDQTRQRIAAARASRDDFMSLPGAASAGEIERRAYRLLAAFDSIYPIALDAVDALQRADDAEMRAASLQTEIDYLVD